MYQRALQEGENLYGPNHDTVPAVKLSLAILYMEQGRLDNAEQMYTWALARYIEKQGFNCQMTMNVIADLGILYQRQEK